MTKVITYGTYDLLHYGHIRLLERAKALGDYLIVGVTSDDFDKTRGKINVQQSLMERIENVRSTGLADKIIIEEYEGQKIDDIQHYNVDIFTVGSDWVGYFDYLKKYCKVDYLDRTAGVSSSELRAKDSNLKLGLTGNSTLVEKYFHESKFVNGADVTAISASSITPELKSESNLITQDTYSDLLSCVDAVYIASHPTEHYNHIRQALLDGKHVLCESPIALSELECKELYQLATDKNLILMDAIKTAYSTAYNRLLLLLKSGKIGNILSVESTCTSLKNLNANPVKNISNYWNSICSWGPTAMLPIFHILGTNWVDINISSLMMDEFSTFDLFTKINFTYPNAVASLKVGKGVKSEGELIISGTKGYIYVPAPWWKTEYFEVRFENQNNNRRYFYQLDGEGIRNELVAFLRAIRRNQLPNNLSKELSINITKVIQIFESDTNVFHITSSDNF